MNIDEAIKTIKEDDTNDRIFTNGWTEIRSQGKHSILIRDMLGSVVDIVLNDSYVESEMEDFLKRKNDL